MMCPTTTTTTNHLERAVPKLHTLSSNYHLLIVFTLLYSVMAQTRQKNKSSKKKNVPPDGTKQHKRGGGTSSQAAATSTAFPPNLLLQYNQKRPHLVLSALVPSAVFVARNFMDPKECQAWIQFAEDRLGFEPMCNPETREYAHRECGRISHTDWDMSDKLYQRMKPIVEEMVQQQQVNITHKDATYAPRTCNGKLRLYRYNKHMSFGKHFDGSEKIPRYQGGKTEITVLVYLSSCQGGATRFYLPSDNNGSNTKKKKKNSNNDDGISFVPEAGTVLLHIHGDRCLEHEADPVLDGVKYVLRTDIVFAPAQLETLVSY
jgi:hypothetical protein